MEYPNDYPPPDPDGRPHIWLDFSVGKPPEVDLGRLSSAGSVRRQEIELGEGLKGVLLDDYDELPVRRGLPMRPCPGGRWSMGGDPRARGERRERG
jgi:hypothetical protein